MVGGVPVRYELFLLVLQGFPLRPAFRCLLRALHAAVRRREGAHPAACRVRGRRGAPGRLEELENRRRWGVARGSGPATLPAVPAFSGRPTRAPPRSPAAHPPRRAACGTRPPAKAASSGTGHRRHPGTHGDVHRGPAVERRTGARLPPVIQAVACPAGRGSAAFYGPARKNCPFRQNRPSTPRIATSISSSSPGSSRPAKSPSRSRSTAVS